MSKLAITSAMQIVADRLTPTRQCTRVAPPSVLPRPTKKNVATGQLGTGENDLGETMIITTHR